jgi:uncharacterized protein
MTGQKSDCLVMAKPGGPRCNLRCDYCYYLDKERLFPAGPMRMSEDVLAAFISRRAMAASGPVIHFEWHGGEPTLLGLDYFRAITRMQRALITDGRTVSNGLQTNGILIDEAWADFLAQEGFSVGLSLDGPEEFHDRFRRAVDGRSTHSNVVNAFRLLKERRVFCNVLCVLHKGNTADPDRLYDYFRDLGARYIQFLPLTGADCACAEPRGIGELLCRIFDRWIREDVGRMVIQIFDEALRPLYGVAHALCVHRETCGEAAVLEHDGSFYACDHFVDERHLIGNIREREIGDLANDPAMIRFGKAKRDTLPRFCRECEALSFCNGGCPKDRIAKAPDGEAGLNCLCEAYRMFFLHARPELKRLAEHMKAGKPLRVFRPEGALELV